MIFECYQNNYYLDQRTTQAGSQTSQIFWYRIDHFFKKCSNKTKN